ncbi:MAG: polysaccharide biosynthesis protein, partial [Ruminococcaceae bacterium]|nr:polysaccharide biosynthesis protein [Oscillospiraceae bacterium]
MSVLPEQSGKQTERGTMDPAAARPTAGRLFNKLFFVLGDLGLVMLAFVLTDYLYSTSSDRPFLFAASFLSPPLAVAWLLAGLIAIPIFSIFSFYGQIWRYASIPQYFLLVVGTLAYSVFVVMASFLLDLRKNTAYYIIFWLVLLFLIGGYRLVFRVLLNRQSLHSLIQYAQPSRAQRKQKNDEPAPRKVMVIGAGYAGHQIVREMLETETNRQPVILIDDDERKHNLSIYHVPVIGGRDKIISAALDFAIDEIILAIPSASRQTMRELVEICKQTACALRVLPVLSDIINGKVSIADIKEVEIEDLLGREEIRLDLEVIATYLRGQVVMVTGGGGSIGSELCRQIIHFQPSRLIVFDIYENNAFMLQQELQSQLHQPTEITVLIGSVRDVGRLEDVIKFYQPSVVFHAAAHKHVPLMQDSPSEAVKNNIMGTYYTALTAGRLNVRRFVFISTDKAVNPTNVMGASKRLAEMTIQYLSRQFP